MTEVQVTVTYEYPKMLLEMFLVNIVFLKLEQEIEIEAME